MKVATVVVTPTKIKRREISVSVKYTCLPSLTPSSLLRLQMVCAEFRNVQRYNYEKPKAGTEWCDFCNKDVQWNVHWTCEIFFSA